MISDPVQSSPVEPNKRVKRRIQRMKRRKAPRVVIKEETQQENDRGNRLIANRGCDRPSRKRVGLGWKGTKAKKRP